jgi:hypothetical protein
MVQMATKLLASLLDEKKPSCWWLSTAKRDDLALRDDVMVW